MLEKNRFEGDTLLVVPPGQRSFTITRTFNAPRRLVFAACTQPEYVQRWYGTSCMTLTLCEMDVRPGGAWRRVFRGPDGQDHGFRGVYIEITPPERLVFSEIFEPFPDSPSEVTITFEDLGAKTKLQLVQLHASVAARDAHIGSGMESGMRESMDRLSALIDALNG
jgi:uncharacterized protein YndB with AHSA1/START domain